MNDIAVTLLTTLVGSGAAVTVVSLILQNRFQRQLLDTEHLLARRMAAYGGFVGKRLEVVADIHERVAHADLLLRRAHGDIVHVRERDPSTLAQLDREIRHLLSKAGDIVEAFGLRRLQVAIYFDEPTNAALEEVHTKLALQVVHQLHCWQENLPLMEPIEREREPIEELLRQLRRHFFALAGGIEGDSSSSAASLSLTATKLAWPPK